MRTFKVTLEYGINVDNKVDYIEIEDDATMKKLKKSVKILHLMRFLGLMKK